MNNIFRKKTALLIALFVSISTFAQNEEPAKYTSSNKGKFYISWGGNRGSFTDSDIRFEGENYDFTIKDVKAGDRPKGWHIDYINPKNMTVPQTNFKLGYYISDKYSISIGLDHMKYVMPDNSTKIVSGFINLPLDESGSQFNGIYNNESTYIPEDLLEFEHTDGLNYVYAEFARHDDISTLFRLPNIDKFQINITEGVGSGILYPKTNAKLLLKERYDNFHVSGYGFHLNVGLNLTFFKHFYIQGDLRGGYINMPDIKTTKNKNDSASQDFWFFQRVISFGGIFRI